MPRSNKLISINSQNMAIALLAKKNLILPALIAIAWLVSALISARPIIECLGLILSQFIFIVFVLRVLADGAQRSRVPYGPRLDLAIGLHMLIYYSLSNVIPALFPETRSETLLMAVTYRIPISAAWAYSVATIAATLLLLGLLVGLRIVDRLWPVPHLRSSRAINSCQWLPPYYLAMISCTILMVFVVIGTIEYGIHFNAEMLTGVAMAGMPLGQQLLYHGLFYFLPIAPMLSTAALIYANKSSQRRLAYWLLPIACLITFTSLVIWGMRSTAIIAMLLPLGLMVYVGKISWRKVIFPTLGLVVVVYGIVTYIRGTELQALLDQRSDITQLTIKDVASSIMTRTDSRSLIKRALDDLSYRTAGLEASASLIQAQIDEHFPLQWGKVISAGYLQALPASLRPTFQIIDIAKTVPAYLGVFKPGDWVTTFLAEFVLDFGPYLLFFPGIIAGFGLALIDRALLGLGQLSSLKGLLILRIAFLLFIISNGGSLAWMTLLFFKATIGYTALFLLLGVIARISLSQETSRTRIPSIGI